MADIEENNGFNDNIIKAKTKSHFSDIADVWNNRMWVKSNGFSNEIIDFASVNGNEVLLYLGIGTEDLAKELPIKTVCGIDLSAKMLSKCENIPRHIDIDLCLRSYVLVQVIF